MALSNTQRQERFRRKLRDDRTALGNLVEGWRAARRSLLRQLEMLEAGDLRTGTNNIDDTSATAARVREHISSYDELIATYDPQVRTGARLVDAGAMAATRVGLSIRMAMADLEARTDVTPEDEPLRQRILAQFRATAEMQEQHLRALRAEPPGAFYDPQRHP
jgi:hypothetical protein